TDLDPTIPGAAVDMAFATATGDPVDSIPDEMRHRVNVEVIAEMVADGGVSQRTLISHSAFADELTGIGPMALLHIKPEAFEAIGVSIGTNLTGTVQYNSVLLAGDSAIAGDERLSFRGGPDVFGDIATGAAVGEAIAEWLDVQIIGPDGRT